MNPAKTKLKYLMGLWKTLPGYPTPEDVAHEISAYLKKGAKGDGEFSAQTLNSVFGQKWEESKHGETISEMLQSGALIETERSTASKKWYRLSKNSN